MDKDKIRQKIQEEIDKLSEDERIVVLERRAERAEEFNKFLSSPEEMLADIDARCKALKEAGLYDADKIEDDFKQVVVSLNEALGVLRNRVKK